MAMSDEDAKEIKNTLEGPESYNIAASATSGALGALAFYSSPVAGTIGLAGSAAFYDLSRGDNSYLANPKKTVSEAKNTTFDYFSDLRVKVTENIEKYSRK